MLTRAYSVVELKSVDEEKRILEGLASTPATDRMGDVVDPKGAVFNLPLPLLWQHRSDQPIGQVTHAEVTPTGIRIRASIAKDLGIPRIDEAWALIKSGLVRGFSIGFKGLEVEEIKGTFGLRFKKWEWLELSTVTVPANSQTTIATIKQFDQGPAATGTETPIESPQPAGVSARPRSIPIARKDRSMKKTIQEQIKDLENTRAAKAARMEEVQTKAVEEGRTKEADEKEEFDNLSQELEGIDSELVDLRRMEKINMQKAQPIQAATPMQAADSRVPGVVSVRENIEPGIGFARFAMCKAASYLSRGEQKASEIAANRYPHDARLHQMFTKATVAAGTTTDATWAGPLVDPANYAGDFVEYLRPKTIIGRIQGLRNVPFNVRILGQTSGGSADWVGQGKPKPLTKFDFNATTLTWAKIAAIAVISEELARFSSPSAERLVRDALAAAVIERMDIDFIDPAKNAVSGVSPASITNGITPMSVSGTDAAAVRADFQALFNAFILDNQDPSTAVLIMPSTVALALSMMVNSLGQSEFPGLTMNGGTFMGIPVITSQYAAWTSPDVNIVVLVNASDIYISDDGQVNIDASREAALEMLDSGFTQNQPTGASLVSLWQNNLIGLKAERFVNWARRRTEAVQWIQNVEWGNAGSPS